MTTDIHNPLDFVAQPTDAALHDPLDLIAQLANEVAHELGAEYEPDRFHEPDRRYAMLNSARTFLTLNARDVPVAVSEILELTLASGGYRSGSSDT